MSITTEHVDAATAAELDAIATAREATWRALLTRSATRDQILLALDAADDIDKRCLELHRRLWPSHRGSLVVTGGAAYLVSPTARSIRKVWER